MQTNIKYQDEKFGIRFHRKLKNY